MITDKVQNIDIYTSIPKAAREYIKLLRPNVELGRVVLNDDIYVNVEEYTTKLLSEAKFEAHEKYIDVQILLTGFEKIYYTQKQNLAVNIPYDEVKDIVFYSDSVKNHSCIMLDGTNFVILYPHEAHAPQVCLNEQPQKVKKAVIKIKVDDL